MIDSSTTSLFVRIFRPHYWRPFLLVSLAFWVWAPPVATGQEQEEEQEDSVTAPIYFTAPEGVDKESLTLWVNGEKTDFGMAVKLNPLESSEIVLENQDGRVIEYQTGAADIDIFTNLMSRNWGLEAYLGRTLNGTGDWSQVGLDGNFMHVGLGLWHWMDALLIRFAIHRATDSASPADQPLIQYRSVSYRIQGGYEWSLGSGVDFVSLLHIGFSTGLSWGVHRLSLFAGSLAQDEEGEVESESRNSRFSGTERGVSSLVYVRYPISQNFWFLGGIDVNQRTIQFNDLNFKVRKPSYEWNASIYFAL